MSFPKLFELVNSKEPFNTVEYGLKAEGLVELLKQQETFANSGNEFSRLRYNVPEGFIITKSADLTDKSNLDDLKKMYSRLVESEEICAVLARSSHENEKPGEFKTIPTTYDNSKQDLSFNDFLTAVKQVRENPKTGQSDKAVVVQKMVGELSTINSDICYGDSQDPIRECTVIGENLTAFTVKSHSPIDPSTCVVNICFGLPTKLVENPDHISIFMNSGQIINTGNSYKEDSAYYFQSTMDVFDTGTNKIIKIPTGDTMQDTAVFLSVCYPRGLSGRLSGLMNIANSLSDQYGVPIELEGVVDRHTDEISIVQMTKSHHLKQELVELTDITDKKSVVLNNVFGSMNFSGDVIFYETGVDQKELDRLLGAYSDKKDDLLLITTDARSNKLDKFATNYVKITSEQFITSKILNHNLLGNVNTHAIGYAVSEIHEKRLQGKKVCYVFGSCAESYSDKLATLLPDSERPNSKKYDSENGYDKPSPAIILLKDVSVKATKEVMQIYFNE